MKRTIGICLFTVFFASLTICALLIWHTQSKAQQKNDIPKDTTEEINISNTAETEQIETAESMAIDEGYRYLLQKNESMLVVYDIFSGNILFETYINTHSLNQATIEQLEKGIYIKDEKELYDILESYSS